MAKGTVNRPDAAALNGLLEREQLNVAGVIVRLAWQQGLTREEIAALMWRQVSELDNALRLPDRDVPLEPEVQAFLQQLREEQAGQSQFVLCSQRTRKPIQPESISRLARQALDTAGQSHIRLMDLRHDWILRQLETQDWSTVSRISGVEIRALQARFAALAAEHAPKAHPPKEKNEKIDEFKLWKVLQAEKYTPAGLALWLSWQMGLSAGEIAELTWEQVALDQELLFLPQRTVPITKTIQSLLEQSYADRQPGDDPHVLLTSQNRRPVDLPRLSRMTRAALIRGGLEQLQLRDLQNKAQQEEADKQLLQYAAEHGPMSRSDVCQLLGVSKTAAYNRLDRLLDQKQLVRIGTKYYLSERVVPPEEHSQVIRDYLRQEGFAYRKDIADLLKIDSRQCTPILRRMVQQGQLHHEKQRYYLPASSE